MRDFELATYCQHIDLAHAEVRGRFEGQEAVVTTRYWCAATENLLFIELSVEKSPGPIGFHVRTEAKINDDPDNASLPTESGSEADGRTGHVYIGERAATKYWLPCGGDFDSNTGDWFLSRVGAIGDGQNAAGAKAHQKAHQQPAEISGVCGNQRQ